MWVLQIRRLYMFPSVDLESKKLQALSSLASKFLPQIPKFKLLPLSISSSSNEILESEKKIEMDNHAMDSMRKLALWYTRTFKPIMTHQQLEPIMATLGFVDLPPHEHDNDAGLVWKEYVFPGRMQVCQSETQSPPRPRLPYPRIDGLHVYTYQSFLEAVNFHLGMYDISNVFHVRGMPLHRTHDKSRKWCHIDENDKIFIYRDGTIDQTTLSSYKHDKDSSSIDKGNGDKSSTLIHDRDSGNPILCLVPLKDILVCH